MAATPGDQLHLRSGFDRAAEIYDRIRPTYPPALFDQLFELLPPPPAIVEVGPGTGQATADLLARGAGVTAVEIGTALAALLRLKLGANPQLKIVEGSFEGAALASSGYDAVVAATAYHWVEAPARLDKPARLLKPGGKLAVIDTNQVASPADRGYFDRVQPIYEKYGQRRDGDELMPTAGAVTPDIYHELLASPRYDDIVLFRYPWDQRYSSEDYADLLRSYSGSQAMPAGEREGLVRELCEVIDRDYDGHITRPLVITLTVARPQLGPK